MSAQETYQEEDRQDLPVVLIHRIPALKLPFASLNSRFALLDPPLNSTESTHSFLSRNASCVRAVLCLGPFPLTSDTLALLPALEIVVVSCVGVDHIDLQECRRRGILVANAGDAFSEDAADCAVGLLIDVFRRVSSSDKFVRAGLWPKYSSYPLGSTLGGKRVGIVGLGSIGTEVAKRLVAFGCSISYTSRKKKSDALYPFYAKVSDLAADSDVLIVCCALTEQTYHVINKDVMTALGKEGVIINVGRGALIDEQELVQFLVRGDLGGAGLDVFKDEPNVPKELLTLDNVVLSPHVAVVTTESSAAVEQVVVGNLEAFFSNKPLLSPVKLD